MGKNYNLPSKVKFSKSQRKNKKYMVEFEINGKPYKIHFGDDRFMHFKDRTPLKLYSVFDHEDKERRARYYMRHGTTTDLTTAKFWASNFLW